MVIHVHDMAGEKSKHVVLLQEILDFEEINEKQTVALVHESKRVESDSVGLSSVLMTACSQTLFHESHHIRMPNYYGEVCIMKSDADFVADYRVSRKTFTKLRDLLRAHMPTDSSHGGSPPISVEESLCITLWYLGNQCCMRDVGDRFNACKATVHRVVRRVSAALTQMAPAVIHWPSGDEATTATAAFEKIAGFPGTFSYVI